LLLKTDNINNSIEENEDNLALDNSENRNSYSVPKINFKKIILKPKNARSIINEVYFQKRFK